MLDEILIRIRADVAAFVAQMTEVKEAVKNVGDQARSTQTTLSTFGEGVDNVGEKAKISTTQLLAFAAAALAVSTAVLAATDRAHELNAAFSLSASRMGFSTEVMQSWAITVSDATLPMDELARTTDYLTRAGIRNNEELHKLVDTFNELGDASGYTSDQIANAMVPALYAFNIPINEANKYVDTWGYLLNNSTIGVNDYSRTITRLAPTLKDFGFNMVDSTALLVAFSKASGLDGRNAVMAFNTAVTETVNQIKTAAEAEVNYIATQGTLIDLQEERTGLIEEYNYQLSRQHDYTQDLIKLEEEYKKSLEEARTSQDEIEDEERWYSRRSEDISTKLARLEEDYQEKLANARAKSTEVYTPAISYSYGGITWLLTNRFEDIPPSLIRAGEATEDLAEIEQWYARQKEDLTKDLIRMEEDHQENLDDMADAEKERIQSIEEAYQNQKESILRSQQEQQAQLERMQSQYFKSLDAIDRRISDQEIKLGEWADAMKLPTDAAGLLLENLGLTPQAINDEKTAMNEFIGKTAEYARKYNENLIGPNKEFKHWLDEVVWSAGDATLAIEGVTVAIQGLSSALVGLAALKYVLGGASLFGGATAGISGLAAAMSPLLAKVIPAEALLYLIYGPGGIAGTHAGGGEITFPQTIAEAYNVPYTSGPSQAQMEAEWNRQYPTGIQTTVNITGDNVYNNEMDAEKVALTVTDLVNRSLADEMVSKGIWIGGGGGGGR